MPTKSKKQKALAETKQVGRFGLIGVLNTIIDFGFYNLFISLAGLPVIAANLLSTTGAMSFSFVANKTFVFRSKDRHQLLQAAKFIAVTAFSVYVIQNLVLYFFKFVWPDPLEALHGLATIFVGDLFSLEFAVNNGAKALAVACGMVWNYLLYKKIVFKK